jgi:exodeoxyribonuclease VII small subunit
MARAEKAADSEDADAESEAPALSYADAVVELRSILDELEHEDIDVDRLAERVERAAKLIESCRARIESARAEVDRIVLEVDDETESG